MLFFQATELETMETMEALQAQFEAPEPSPLKTAWHSLVQHGHLTLTQTMFESSWRRT